jgi:hypothetical protein
MELDYSFSFTSDLTIEDVNYIVGYLISSLVECEQEPSGKTKLVINYILYI